MIGTRRGAVAALALSLATSIAWADPDFPAMLKRVDDITNFTSDFAAVYSMVSERPGEEPKEFEAQVFRRDRDDKLVILILAPDSQKGQGYLEVDKNLWFYDPQSRLFSHASLKDNFQSTDAMNGDFYRTTLARDYEVKSWREGNLGSNQVYILDVKGRNNEVAFPNRRLWLHKELGMILKAEDYSLSMRLMRTAYYPNYVKIGDRYIASRALLVDELNKGDKTQLTLKEPSTAALPDSTFTKAYLERVSR